MTKLCTVPGCDKPMFGHVDGQASIMIYERMELSGTIVATPVCSAHYAQALLLPNMYETEYEALAQRKEIGT